MRLSTASLARERAEHVAADVARQHLRGREHDHAQQEERDQREREPLEQEPGDRLPPPSTAPGRRRCGGPAQSDVRLGERRVAEEHRARGRRPGSP